MTLVTTSAPWQNVNMPALDLRRYLSVGLQKGVGSSTDMTVGQRGAGANFSVDISSGEAVVLGETITKQGMYYAYNDATFNLTGFTAAHATLPRVDRVALRVRDSFHGDAASDLAFVIVTGTATAGATLANLTGAAAVPAGHLLLANVLIPATATTVTTANIATTYQTVRPSWTPTTITSTTSAWASGPPGSPVDGQIWYATSVDANGRRWAFQYNAGSGSASKWEFIGGPPLYVSIFNQETTTSTGFTDLASVGPAIALTRAGDWQIDFGAEITSPGAASAAVMSYAISGGTTSGAASPGATLSTGGGASSVSVSASEVRTGIAAASTVTAKYLTNSGTGQFGSRWVRIHPIRIA